MLSSISAAQAIRLASRLETSTKQSTISKTNVTSFFQTAAQEFRKAFGFPPTSQTRGNPYSLTLQMKLIKEEGTELSEAICLLTSGLDGEAPHALKELADLVYVCFQLAASQGWDLQTAYNRVHLSNMSKLGADGNPIRREDGKVLKGPNYFEPDMTDLIGE